MVHGDYYVTLIVIVSFQKDMLTLTILNVLMGHHLDFTEDDWSAQ